MELKAEASKTAAVLLCGHMVATDHNEETGNLNKLFVQNIFKIPSKRIMLRQIYNVRLCVIHCQKQIVHNSLMDKIAVNISDFAMFVYPRKETFRNVNVTKPKYLLCVSSS